MGSSWSPENRGKVRYCRLKCALAPTGVVMSMLKVPHDGLQRHASVLRTSECRIVRGVAGGGYSA